MAKKIQLTIPEPCQEENWNSMTPVDKGRFCGSCQKQVVDFSNMSDREVAQFFKKPSTGSVCGRFMQDQLNRDMEVPKKRIPWIKYFFQIALPAFLLSAKAKSQGSVKITKSDTLIMPWPIFKSKTSNQKKPVLIDKMMGFLVMTPSRIEKLPVEKDEMVTIKGKVVDESNKAITGVSISIKGTSIGVTTNNAGEYSLKLSDASNDITLIASSVGFSTLEKRISKGDFAKEDRIILMPLTQLWLGEVVVVGMISPKKKIKSKAIRIIPETRDTLVKVFKIYPNPVPSRSNITLEWKETEEGYYTVQLLNQPGQAVFEKEIWIDAEARVLSLDLPSVTAGSYFIRVINKKSGKNSAEKIIIQ